VLLLSPFAPVDVLDAPSVPPPVFVQVMATLFFAFPS
jgi:hypothetical protein